jgi:hypothetical protein
MADQLRAAADVHAAAAAAMMAFVNVMSFCLQNNRVSKKGDHRSPTGKCEYMRRRVFILTQSMIQSSFLANQNFRRLIVSFFQVVYADER